jgi:hypothetical protein
MSVRCRRLVLLCPCRARWVSPHYPAGRDSLSGMDATAFRLRSDMPFRLYVPLSRSTPSLSDGLDGFPPDSMYNWLLCNTIYLTGFPFRDLDATAFRLRSDMPFRLYVPLSRSTPSLSDGP